VAFVVGTRGHDSDASYLFVFRVNPRQIEIANQYSAALRHKIYRQNAALPNGDHQYGALKVNITEKSLLSFAKADSPTS
jgi:hypothetical protein